MGKRIRANRVKGTNIALKFYRQKEKMSQADLAEFLSTSQTQLARYEIGESEPSFGFIVNFCELLRIDLNDFVKTARLLGSL